MQSKKEKKVHAVLKNSGSIPSVAGFHDVNFDDFKLDSNRQNAHLKKKTEKGKY